MKLRNNLTLSTSPQLQPARKLRSFANLDHRHRSLYGRTRRYNTGKEPDPETGLYYFGARYLDPKASRWLSGDPAMGEYLPSAPVSEEARKRNGNLPGMGGVFNYANLHAYHYAGNNPVKYTDPDGETTIVIYLWNKNDWWNNLLGGSHIALYVSDPGHSKLGDANRPALYDPSGSYSVDKKFGTRPSSGVFYGYEDSDIDNYLDYHLGLGAGITLYVLDTTREQETDMLARAYENGEGPADIFCAMNVSDVLEEIGGKQKFTPRGVKNQMETWVAGNRAEAWIVEKRDQGRIYIKRDNTEQ